MHEEGSGSLAAFLVAGVIFLVSLGAVVWTSQSTATDDSLVADAATKSQAESLLDTLLNSEGEGYVALEDLEGLEGTGEGSGVNTGAATQTNVPLDGDEVERMGFRSPSGGMALENMNVLRGAADVSADNDLLDYEDARASLGLTTDEATGLEPQFHLRIYPVGDETGTALLDLAEIRTAYVGDWSTLAKVTVDYQLNNDGAMVRDANTKLNLSMNSGVASERDMLSSLGLDFQNRVYMTTGYPDVKVKIVLNTEVPLTTLVDITLWRGDVFPDDKTYLQNTLVARLEDYDLLVIGSGVDQQTLTANAIKDGVRDWVVDGGTLVVLGSGDANMNWLQPLFDVKTSTMNGSPFAGDPSHPLLTTPAALDWTSYPSSSKAWDLKGDEAYDSFSHVIVADDVDILAVSNEGAYGDGRIFLTSYQPFAIAAALSNQEGMDFLENVIRYTDQESLYLEYGPAVPDGTRVSSAVRHSYITDDDIGQVPVRIELLFWYA